VSGKSGQAQFNQDPDNPFPGKGKMKPEEAEIFRLKRELMKVTAERDILEKSARVLRGKNLSEVRLCGAGSPFWIRVSLSKWLRNDVCAKFSA
jgi:hypothetical protein